MAARPTLQSERLVLRPFTMDDAPQVQRYCADREVARTTAVIPHPYLDGMAAEWIIRQQAAFDEGRSISFAIVDRASGELVGAIDLRPAPEHGRAEAGYVIYRPFWGRGYATDALRLVIEYAFSTLGLYRVEAHHFENNPASGRVMEKCGMALEGRMRQHVVKWGQRLDTLHYAILCDDYDAGHSSRDTMSYTTKQIAELFPDLMQIKDAALRDNVAAVWNEALTTGCGGKGWTFEELRSIPFTLLAGDIDLTFVEHLNSCARQCIAIARVLRECFGDRVPIHVDHLIAGSLLADCGKPLEFDKDESGKLVKGHYGDMLRHPFSGVAMCYKHGIPAEVMHIVATHSHEGDKVQRSIESIIFHHADFVDFDIAKYLGAVAAKRQK